MSTVSSCCSKVKLCILWSCPESQPLSLLCRGRAEPQLGARALHGLPQQAPAAEAPQSQAAVLDRRLEGHSGQQTPATRPGHLNPGLLWPPGAVATRLCPCGVLLKAETTDGCCPCCRGEDDLKCCGHLDPGSGPQPGCATKNRQQDWPHGCGSPAGGHFPPALGVSVLHLHPHKASPAFLTDEVTLSVSLPLSGAPRGTRQLSILLSVLQSGIARVVRCILTGLHTKGLPWGTFLSRTAPGCGERGGWKGRGSRPTLPGLPAPAQLCCSLQPV